MIATLLLGAGLLAAEPAAPSGADLKAYETARDAVGRGADAQVKLALWCEAHGLTAERARHLALAVLTDPKNAAARGLMGLVSYRGKWARPEDVGAKVKADEALARALAEYNGRRARTASTGEAHWKLALWCEEVGLAPEARAHFAAAVRLDPGREAAWKRLGYKKVGGRWVTDAQLAAEKAEAEARRKADQHWKPLLTKWRGWLRNKDRRAEAEEALAAVDDPRAVPAAVAVFAAGDAADQATAVPLLGHIDAPASSRALAMLAVYGRERATRRAAAETLRRRDPRDFVDLLVALIRDPLKYQARPVGGPGMPGELFIEGEKFNVHRVYGANPDRLPRIPPRIFADSVPFDPFGAQNMLLWSGVRNPALEQAAANPANAGTGALVLNTQAAAVQRDAEIARAVGRVESILAVSQQQLNNDVAALEAYNANARTLNQEARSVLHAVTNQDLGESSKSWRAWWTDQKGYALRTEPDKTTKPTFTDFVENPYAMFTRHSCFGAGTPVRTLDGSRPIESIRTGDQVLTQDTATGKLSFTPVLAVYHNKPAATLRLVIGSESVAATPIHRFWKAGHGWTTARELKPGDVVRTVGGTARVGSVETDRVQPVFNLEVAEGQSFFVGGPGVLVHDNSLVEPVNAPFDAPAEVAALANGAR